MISRDRKRCPTHPGELLRDDILPSMAEVKKITPDCRVWVLMEFMSGQKRVAVRAGQLRTI
jgi:hypothetical protein